MPICINFLAEQQAHAEQRRKDPVKRGYLAAAVLVGVTLSIYLFIQLKLWGAHSEASIFDNKFKTIEMKYKQALTNKVQLDTTQLRLSSIDMFGRERMLWANALNAMQFAAAENVPLTEFAVDQTWLVTDAVPLKTNADGSVVTAAKPARSKETIRLRLTAKDYGPPAGGQPGDLIESYQQKLQDQPFFRSNVTAIRRLGRSMPQVDASSGKQFVEFKLECDFVGKER